MQRKRDAEEARIGAEQDCRHEDGGGRVRHRRPIGEGAGEERLRRDEDQHRQREGEQSALGLRTIAADAAPDDDEKRAEQNGSEGAELGAEEFERRAQMDRRSPPAGIGGGVRESGKAMGGVPGEVGRDDGERERASGEAAPLAQGRARVLVAPRIDGRAEEKIDGGVFGEQAHADGRADKDRIGHAAGLDEPDPSEQSERPAGEQRHVGGDQALRRTRRRAGWRRRWPTRSRCARRKARAPRDRRNRRSPRRGWGRARARTIRCRRISRWRRG